MKFFLVEPIVPGGIVRVSGAAPASATQAPVFAYDYFTTEPIFNNVADYFVTDSCAALLRQGEFRGFELRSLLTQKSEKWQHLVPPGTPEPESVHMLTVTGTCGVDDMGLQNKVRLIVSARLLELLRSAGMRKAQVLDYDPHRRPLTRDELRKKYGRKPKP